MGILRQNSLTTGAEAVQEKGNDAEGDYCRWVDGNASEDLESR